MPPILLDAFDFLVVAFLNIGKFFGGNDGTSGAAAPEFYTLGHEFIREHHDASTTWQKVKLRGMDEQIAPFKNEAGFDLIAKALGIPPPSRLPVSTNTPAISAGGDEPTGRLARLLATLAVERKTKLDELKAEAVTLERDDAIWHMLLGAFSTLGGSRGWDGLIGNRANYNRVTFDAIARLSPAARVSELETVMLAARVRYPAKKAVQLVENFDVIRELGGLVATRDRLLRTPGRDGKIAFLKRFKGIGDKYGRDILMDCYHPEFRDSIALDSRVRSVTAALGLTFKTYSAEEAYYLDVARCAGLNGWEVDRLIYNYRDEVLHRLKKT